MLGMIKEKIGLKISLLTSIILFIVTVVGVTFLFMLQSRQFDADLKYKGKMAAMIGAKAVGTILEEAVDNGALSLSDVMDTDYVKIPGFDPAKYHTKYDSYTDKALQSFQDEFLKLPDILYAGLMDRNGYASTHNSRFSKPITGDYDTDLKWNRTKRMFKDEISTIDAGNLKPGLVQQYRRDTGEVIWDISSPIYVKDKHWGCFRVGFALTTVNKAKRSFLIALCVSVFLFLFISMVSVFFLINRSLAPLTDFTRIASDLADGHMDEKIKWETRDEIGKLADAMERLRVSLKAAMDRLLRK